MTDTEKSRENLNKLFEVNGINIFNIKSDRFKTNTISIFFQDNLNENSAAMNALFPSVLRRGTQNLPTLKDINLYLEELYGAVFDCGIAKKGERQIIHFFFEYLSDKYANDENRNFEGALEFLLDMVYRPFLKEGVFHTEYVEQEKTNLKMLIQSRTNDKVQYSMDRCYELMCQEEPFGLYEYGTLEQIEKITPGELYKHYRDKVATLPADIFITGQLEDSDIEFLKAKISSIERGVAKGLTSGIVKKYVDTVKYFEDRMDVTQGKLSMGFRTNITPKEDDYYALMVYSGILGGGMHSKLFQNVREKAGLAYYVFTGLEKFKGLMIIGSGIDIKQKDRAKELILEQLEAIKDGRISDYEFESTIKSLETGIYSLKDSQLQVVDFNLSQLIAQTHDTFEGILAKIKKVTKKDVINVTKKIQLDTVYFLTSKASEADSEAV
ncbi:antilisterial bacteriocin subtilosin biosynthesis protein AlbE [Ruminiclostridium hungatei]|uniref:Antilisterial bacteriocin subtilosin biosynthesis protein AlbE n=1 Tax=Ruminiclostridium hungatei TaxID=48256 RepID=A0A1V4SS11_RUMHU|nr:pitrilysin family protein [Ruminiclostridium hungatei]OPX46236.1 antilisterial bacteriocin subtilosin biosynthesis protein AlbE [Ruminiclostridium hungatei]